LWEELVIGEELAEILLIQIPCMQTCSLLLYRLHSQDLGFEAFVLPLGFGVGLRERNVEGFRIPSSWSFGHSNKIKQFIKNPQSQEGIPSKLRTNNMTKGLNQPLGICIMRGSLAVSLIKYDL
jgi:hypothetical protein